MTSTLSKTLIALALPIAILGACSSNADADTSDGTSADADGNGEISNDEIAAEMESAALSITPGQWEATVQLTEFDFPQMPEQVRGMMREQMGQPQTSRSCITPEEAADPEGSMFGQNAENGCTYSEFSMSGGNMLIEATCRPAGSPGTMNMRMEGTYTATSYNMNMAMNMDAGPAGPMSMSGQVTGNYVGPDCGAEG